MATEPKIGPVGKRVADNLEQLRRRGRVPVRELSARLNAAGRPILPSGITKIEKKQRRVDVDDLVALATALDESPLTLLAPPSEVSGDLEDQLEEEGVRSDALREALRAITRAVDAGVPIEKLFDLARRTNTVIRVVIGTATESDEARTITPRKEPQTDD